MEEPHEKFAKHRPRVGHFAIYNKCPTERRKIIRVEGNLCWYQYPDGEVLPFIWCFKDGLNTMHSWPTK